MAKPGTPKSLTKSITRRVGLLSLMGVMGVMAAIGLSLLLTLSRVEASLNHINIEAASAFDLFFLDIQSNLLATGEGLASRDDVNSALLTLRTRNNAFLDVLFIGPDGAIIMQRNAVGRPQRVTIEESAWLDSPPSFGEALIGPVRFEGQTPYVEMAVSVTDAIGLPAGLLLVRVDLTQLWNRTLDIHVGSTGYAYIVADTGQLVAFRNRRLLEAGSNLQELVGRTPQKIAASSLSFYTSLNAQPVLATAQPLKTVPWFAIVEQPVYEALAPFAPVGIGLLLVIAVMGALLRNTLQFTRNRIVSPLFSLRNAVRQMENGSLETSVKLPRNDELGQLGQAFNQMTAQIQSQTESLRESEARYRVLFEQSPDGIVILNPEIARPIEFNDQVCRQLGYTREEFSRLTLADIEVVETVEESLAHIQKVMREGRDNFETRQRTKQGDIRDVHVTAQLIDVGGQPIYHCIWRDITERKKTEEAVRVSEERLTSFMNSASDSFYLLDSNLNFVEMNARALEIVGRRKEDVIGRNIADIVPDVKRSGRYERHLNVIRTGKPFVVEDFVPHPVFGPRHFVLTSFKVGDGLGVIAHDITERKQAEEALRKSEEKFAKAFQASPIMVSITRVVDACLIEVNESFEKVLGYTREGAIGRTTMELGIMDPADRDHLLPILLANGKLRNEELQLRAKSGEAITGLYSAELIELDGEKCILSTVENITERKRAEEERERLTAQVWAQAQQMEQILTTVPTGVLLLDAEWRVIRTNPVAERDLAVLGAVQVGDILARLGDRPLTELLTSPPTQGLWHEVKAGERVFEVIARPVESGAAPEHWVLVLNDVTREREIQAQLQQQERLAAVGQLAAGIAHDFNNIMAIIVLYAQMGLRTKDVPPKLRERLEIVSQQANRATDLIQQILDFSRQTVLDRRTLYLTPFLKEMVKLLERTVPENIKIELTCGMDEYIIDADPTRLQQALMNLVVNARDAMPEGGDLHITLSKTAESAEAQCVICGQVVAGEWVRLTVADSGTGIPPEALPHIFEPFFTTKEIGKGTGLGLAQVYGIVAKHTGHLTVATRVGKGTAFTIYLPTLLAQHSEPLSPVAEALIRGQGETLLVVEDNATLRLALVDSLTLLNYQVLEATNGREALDILETHSGISLVVSDVVMPEMGGLALFHALREKGGQMPMILLTGHPMDRELESLRNQGLKGWLLKPPDMEKLARAVAEALHP